MYDVCMKNRDKKTIISGCESDFQNFEGFIKIPFCETEECEKYLKEKYKFSARCIPFKCPICGKKSSNYVFFAKAY